TAQASLPAEASTAASQLTPSLLGLGTMDHRLGADGLALVGSPMTTASDRVTHRTANDRDPPMATSLLPRRKVALLIAFIIRITIFICLRVWFCPRGLGSTCPRTGCRSEILGLHFGKAVLHLLLHLSYPSPFLAMRDCKAMVLTKPTH